MAFELTVVNFTIYISPAFTNNNRGQNTIS
jgi:hypothetical protein